MNKPNYGVSCRKKWMTSYIEWEKRHTSLGIRCAEKSFFFNAANALPDGYLLP